MRTLPLQVAAKPVDDQCHLQCRYCQFRSKPESHSKPMADDVLANYIQQTIESSLADEVTFSWQGGEPTLAGLSFYEKVVRWQSMFADGKTIHNDIQTNGWLLNGAWCDFLANNQWRVGFSIDGDQSAHNAYRVQEHGRPTYAKVVENLKSLRKAGVRCYAMVAVHQHNVHEPLKHYQHLLSLGFSHFQFTPLTRSEQLPQKQPWHISGDEYGHFLVTIFEHWQRHDIGRVTVEDFESAYATLQGLPATLCAHAASCGHALVVLKKGEVYSCEHYVNAEHFLGNLTRSSLHDMQLAKPNVTFGIEKTLNIPEACQACSVLPLCQGGCRRHRLLEDGRSVLCAGYFAFFTQVQTVFKPEPSSN